jgi:hypothetical protein
MLKLSLLNTPLSSHAEIDFLTAPPSSHAESDFLTTLLSNHAETYSLTMHLSTDLKLILLTTPSNSAMLLKLTSLATLLIHHPTLSQLVFKLFSSCLPVQSRFPQLVRNKTK